MKIVIDITDEEYEDVKKTGGCYYDFGKAIYYGTPLPKGHGRIGVLDQLLLWMIYKKGIIDELKCGEIAPIFKDATIIKADIESEE